MYEHKPPTSEMLPQLFLLPTYCPQCGKAGLNVSHHSYWGRLPPGWTEEEGNIWGPLELSRDLQFYCICSGGKGGARNHYWSVSAAPVTHLWCVLFIEIYQTAPSHVKVLGLTVNRADGKRLAMRHFFQARLNKITGVQSTKWTRHGQNMWGKSVFSQRSDYTALYRINLLPITIQEK